MLPHKKRIFSFHKSIVVVQHGIGCLSHGRNGGAGCFFYLLSINARGTIEIKILKCKNDPINHLAHRKILIWLKSGYGSFGRSALCFGRSRSFVSPCAASSGDRYACHPIKSKSSSL